MWKKVCVKIKYSNSHLAINVMCPQLKLKSAFRNFGFTLDFLDHSHKFTCGTHYY